MSISIVGGAASSRPGILLLAAGVIFPAGVIGFELATRFCAALGFVAVSALDLPAAATRLAVRWAAAEEPGQLQRGLDLMRLAGDHDLLLRLCYESNGRPSGLLSAIAMGWGWGPFGLFGA